MHTRKEIYRLDFSNLTAISDLHPYIKTAMAFPEYYGESWYAFWDCITDLLDAPLQIEITGIEWLQKNYPLELEILLAYLKDLKHYADDTYADIIHITVITGETRTELT